MNTEHTLSLVAESERPEARVARMRALGVSLLSNILRQMDADDSGAARRFRALPDSLRRLVLAAGERERKPAHYHVACLRAAGLPMSRADEKEFLFAERYGGGVVEMREALRSVYL